MMHSDQTQFTPDFEAPCLDDLQSWQRILEKVVLDHADGDGSHDLSHCRRVYRNTQAIDAGSDEHCHPFVLLAASYLHDIVNLPKNHPERHLTSRKCAEKGAEILRGLGVPEDLVQRTAHAIETHSYSAGKTPETWEAKVLQDADRLDALGAVGIARCFYVNGRMGTALYQTDDPRGESRDLDDKSFALDHFEQKLLKLPQLMQTRVGRKLGHQRAKLMSRFREQLINEVDMQVFPLPPSEV